MVAGFAALLAGAGGTGARVAAARAALQGPGGRLLRRQLSEWVVAVVPVETLVPPIFSQWRPLVADAMRFVVMELSAARLAPKIVQQIELSADTPPETRLLSLIARVPGLQKIGQIIARNRNLPVKLRRALAHLENGIEDISPQEVAEILRSQLGSRVETYGVKLAPVIFSEASVSAVVRFTWRNPASGRCERGVFKVMKPFIPACYAEDMRILERLAAYLVRRHRGEGPHLAGLAETLTEIRLLLEREVDFRREQATLARPAEIYRRLKGVRVPRVIAELSTDAITALTEERGVKVTSAFRKPGPQRVRVAERLAEALLAMPALGGGDQTIYHADPHAGNLLYDRATDELVILDWALTERLTREQRRDVLMLVLMLALREPREVCDAIDRLRQPQGRGERARVRAIRNLVAETLDELPPFHLPGPLQAMKLLDRVALAGVRFPAALLMFRKASFTLDGVTGDVAGHSIRIDTVVARYALSHWLATATTLARLLSPRDWLRLDWAALTLGVRLVGRAVDAMIGPAAAPVLENSEISSV